MPFIPTPNGVEVTFKGVQNGIPIVNIFHVDNDDVPTESDLEAIGELFDDWLVTNWLPILHESYLLPQIVVKDISVENGIEFTKNFTPPYQGTGTNDPMAANAAMVVSWRTAQTGRSFRGRTYIGGLDNGVLANAQNVTTTFASDAADLIVTLLDALTATGRRLAVLSKYANGVARVTGLLTEIISIIIDTKIDSQRRRTAN